MVARGRSEIGEVTAGLACLPAGSLVYFLFPENDKTKKRKQGDYNHGNIGILDDLGLEVEEKEEPKVRSKTPWVEKSEKEKNRSDLGVIAGRAAILFVKEVLKPLYAHMSQPSPDGVWYV